MKVFSNVHIAPALVLTGLLAACSSGGSVTTPSTIIPPAPPGATTTSFVISLNGGGGETVATSGKRPAFVSPSTASITFAVDGGSVSTQNLTAASTDCAAANGGVRCTIPLANVAAGTHALSLTTWDGANGTGNKLGANTNIGFTVVANQANSVNAVVGGIATSINLVPVGAGATGNMTQGYTIDASSRPQVFIAEPLDAAGNVIVGPGAPSVSGIAGSTGIVVAAGTAPNTFAVTVLNPGRFSPSPVDFGPGALELALTPAAGAGGSVLYTNVHLYVFVTRIYVVNAPGTIEAFDENGVQFAHPQASDDVNIYAAKLSTVAFDPATNRLLAVQGTEVRTYDFLGDSLYQLAQGTASLGTALTWDSQTSTGYGYDVTGKRLVQFDAIEPTGITPIGPVVANDYGSLETSHALLGGGTTDYLLASTESSILLILPDGTLESPLAPPTSVGPIVGLALDPVTSNLWVAGVGGLAVYPAGQTQGPPKSITVNGTPTSVAVDPHNDLVYMTDSSGNVQVFNQAGVPQFTFSTGAHPFQIVITP